MPSVIALDAMGSDKAPKPEIEGALQAARHHGVRVLLVGPEPQLRAELARYPGARRLPVDVVHASEVITMEDKVEAIRAKRDSSIRVGLRLVREGRAAGFVTAGNTGAAMATAKVVLGALPGVDRPALAAAFPTVAEHGSDSARRRRERRLHAQQSRAVRGDGRNLLPLDFRHEASAGGPALDRRRRKQRQRPDARRLFSCSSACRFNFIGNVEGRDLYNGHVDVIVADGFVGNVALKTSEGVARLVRAVLKETLKSTITRQVGAYLSRNAFSDFKKRLDHTEYGGAPLLGVKGVCIITHGSSNTNAIKNAVRVAAEFAEGKVNETIERELAQLSAAVATT